jgi:hypothetical protein
MYKGINYHYAFEFSVDHAQNPANREFQIAISNYRESSCDFSGLCLGNELKVTSQKKEHLDAFYEIINKIILFTIQDDIDYNNENPGKFPEPLMKVTDEKFIKKFIQMKESEESLRYYEQLVTKFYENIKTKSETISEEKFKDIIMYFHLVIQLVMILNNIPHIKLKKFGII